MRLKQTAEEITDDETGEVYQVSGFDIGNLTTQTEHVLIQNGTYLECKTPGHHHGTRIPQGKILNMRDGRYVLEELIPVDFL